MFIENKAMGKHQGKVLNGLANMDERPIMELGKLLGITPTYISRLFKMEKLSEEIIQRACVLFGVEPSVFYDENDPAVVPNNKKLSIFDYEDQIKTLEASIKRLAAELEREKAMTDTMRQALEKYFKTDT